MGQRLDFQAILQALIGPRTDGKRNVYFQPPSTISMNYPCIVYSRSQINTKRANNNLYGSKTAYQVMVIDPDPDSLIPSKVLSLPMCSFDRNFTADNLNHDVFNVYY